ncbi:MAG: glycoside hydrolase family 13 protein [Coleofasciculus sp. G3-WIS-01]|uniref:glycoside hydrolase family 13 protein n=1 Tax=Coleofasciculus sp. G3-WIS-01 TaxID=3069528 RepID=UPI0032FA0E22
MQIQTPDWVKHAVFYQIFPDRFAKGHPPRSQVAKTLPLEPWDALPTLQGYKGGDLWGVMEKLDYLQDLGVNAIYFTPIFQSASNHRYHTHDYYQIDPVLGGNGTFMTLLEKCHQREMKVVLDGVFNHASRGFFFFHDILENGPYSPWLDWFKIERWPLSAYDGSKPANYVGWEGNRALPEFNHDNPDVREYIMQVAEYWIKLGVDGWRLDVAYEIEAPGFWQEFRDRVKAINPDAYIVGEVWVDSRQWLDGTQFDGVMNYLFTGPTIAFTAGDRVVHEYVEQPSYEPYPPLDAPGYAAKIEHLLQLYPWEIQLTQLNLLASHDTARLLSIASGGKKNPSAEAIESVKLATLLLFTFLGAPSIYYGDEVGLPGALDPDSRRGFPLESQWNQEILDCHRQLIALRHHHPALRTGSYKVLFAEGMTYIFARQLEADELIIAVNAGMTTTQVQVEAPPELSPRRQILYGDACFTWNQNNLAIELPPRTGCILG